MIEPTDEMVAAFEQHGTGGYGDITDTRDGLAAVLAIIERDQAAELVELRALFELQQTRMQEATARWRAEDPEARALVMPDLGALLQWLMDARRRMTPEEALKQLQQATGLRVFAVLDPDGTAWWATGKAETPTFECTIGDRVLHIDELASRKTSAP